MADPYHATVLDSELRAAGLDIHGCSSKGRIDWKRPPTAVEQKKADAVLKAHDPTKPGPREVQAAKLEMLRAKRRAGKALTAKEQQELLDHILGV